MTATASSAKNVDRIKETERAEIHRTIWRIANDLRGSVDGWDFKQYILGMMFYRFISENLADHLHEDAVGAGFSSYADMPDNMAQVARTSVIEEKGYFILPSELFENVRKNARQDENLNETLATVFKNIEGSSIGFESEGDIKGLFDDIDVNSTKLGPTVVKRNERLSKLLEEIGDLKLGSLQDNTVDAFGDAYEFLMAMYASSAGKSGGEYFTPQEVSELLVRIAAAGKNNLRRVYDPACGSGSLLLKFAKILNGAGRELHFYGQEINLTTFNLCRINMFLHNVNFSHFEIAHGDTLSDPQHQNEDRFDAIVSNPPYSIKWEGKDNPLLINDSRFSPAGVLAPKSKADLAFVMHSLERLAVDGTAAIVCFPGVMYRGGAEKKIRQYLVDNNFVDAVIQLPPDLFFGTTIATCILVLKKSKADSKVQFIDASELFTRVANTNKLTDENIAEIMDVYNNREEKDHFSSLIDPEEIEENDYTLSVSTYVEPEDLTEVIDIDELNKEIEGIVQRQQELRTAIDAIVKELAED